MNEKLMIFELIAYCQNCAMLSTNDELYEELEEITGIPKEDIEDYLEG